MTHFVRGKASINLRQDEYKEDDFDWSNEACEGTAAKMEESFSLLKAPSNESHYYRCKRMLTQLRRACYACSMCELGRKQATKDEKLHLDPHVFSNQNPVRFMVVGQNPGWDELKKSEPFVGQAGGNFDKEIKKHGLSRGDFYICNMVRCYTHGNAKPETIHVERCRPFLQMEINVIRPLLVITLGAVPFEQLCPGVVYSKGLGDITHSERYEVPVFAIYHPSPLNFREETRKVAFEKQIGLMCGLVKELKK